MNVYLMVIQITKDIRLDIMVLSPLTYNEVQKALQDASFHVEGETSRIFTTLEVEDIWKCLPDMVLFIPRHRRITMYAKGEKKA